MACYLCAYQIGEQLSAGGDSLGTCWKCSVWACSLHGTRHGQFECHICTPAAATQNATGGAGAPADRTAPAAAIGYQAGLRAAGPVRENVEAALNVIREHQAPSVDPLTAMRLTEPRSGDPHLILNFAEVVRERSGIRDDFVPGVEEGTMQTFAEPPEPAAVSIDAIGAVVRETFAGRTLEVTPDVVAIVTGALLLSMAVANRPRWLGPIGDRLLSVAADAEIVPPWEVTHPVLLDPVMWLVATAYTGRR
ncbi:MAG: hypothetical protein ACJ768_01090 [Gaiellaceae bacterium]